MRDALQRVFLFGAAAVGRASASRRYALLRKKKAWQEVRFSELAQRYHSILRSLPRGEHPFITKQWVDFNSRVIAAFSPNPPFNFLRNGTIQNTMVFTNKRIAAAQLRWLQSNPQLANIPDAAEEDLVGGPLLAFDDPLTSAHAVLHGYHLGRFTATTRCGISNIERVIEWGGGYGNMAKMIMRLNPKIGYTIIDTAPFIALQWLYLTTIFDDRVTIADSSSPRPPAPGTFQLIPVHWAEHMELSSDLFVSTWALSESTLAAQDFVRRRIWFGARHLMLGYQKASKLFPAADQLERIAQDDGAIIESFQHRPDNYYAFK